MKFNPTKSDHTVSIILNFLKYDINYIMVCSRFCRLKKYMWNEFYDISENEYLFLEPDEILANYCMSIFEKVYHSDVCFNRCFECREFRHKLHGCGWGIMYEITWMKNYKDWYHLTTSIHENGDWCYAEHLYKLPFPIEFTGFTDLTKISLPNIHKILKFPHTIINFTNLKTFTFCNDNDFKQIPENFSQLTNLSTLCLRNNSIDSGFDVLGKMTNITDLDLSYNNVWDNTDKLTGLHNLERLNLEGNCLNNYSCKNFTALTALQYLQIASNNISEILFTGMKNLNELEISDTYKRSLEHDVYDISQKNIYINWR